MGLIQALSHYTALMARGESALIHAGAGPHRFEFQVLPPELDDGGSEQFSIEKMWRTQPHLRTVVDFIARNIAQLGLHVFAEDAGERKRIRSGRVFETLRQPNPRQTSSEFILALVTEIALYDDAYVWVHPDTRTVSGWALDLLPAGWVYGETDMLGNPSAYAVSVNGKTVELPPEQVIRFKGWTPGDPASATSPVRALQSTLYEQAQARKYRASIWKHSGRFGGMFIRPKDAPVWDDQARRIFDEMRKDFSRGGTRAGDDMLLEDGMEYKRVGFSAKEDQWVETTKLSLETVCQVFHVNPTMVGATTQGQSYASVKEFSRGLYTETLGPWLRLLQDRINLFILPALSANPGVFVEFNIEEKMRGSFEEQAAVMSTAVGGPWMTRNEARKIRNLPAIEGAGDLIVPLNVTEGGLASPRDGGTGRPRQPKSLAEVIEGWRNRQIQAAKSRQGAGQTDWWKPERAKTQLAEDLAKAGHPPEVIPETVAREMTSLAETLKIGETQCKST